MDSKISLASVISCKATLAPANNLSVVFANAETITATLVSFEV